MLNKQVQQKDTTTQKGAKSQLTFLKGYKKEGGMQYARANTTTKLSFSRLLAIQDCRIGKGKGEEVADDICWPHYRSVVLTLSWLSATLLLGAWQPCFQNLAHTARECVPTGKQAGWTCLVEPALSSKL